MRKGIVSIALSLFVALTACSSEKTTEKSETSAVMTAQSEEVTKMNYTVDPTKPLVALTFDDGPNITTTVSILDVLEEYQVPASFFLVGNNITDETAPVVKRAYDIGCEIGNHSKSHGYLNQMEAEEIISEVDFVTEKVREITGEPTKFFRPPYIAVNDTMYENINMPFICGVGCNDWDNKVSIDERVEKTLEQVQDGTIILLHDSQGNIKTVKAIERIIPALIDEGYQFVTVSELFNAKNVEISPDDTNLYSQVK